MPPSKPQAHSPRNRRTRWTFAVPLSVFALLAYASRLAADDFWIIPNAFVLAAGSTLELRGQTSSLFPTSKSAVAVDRVADARLWSARGSLTLSERSISGPSLMFRQRVTTTGQHLVAVSISPRTVRESPASFREYMRLEGAPDALARYEREGRLPPATSGESLTRRYAKYAKAVVQVGQGGPRAFQRVVGHPLEFVPLTDPAALKEGDTLRVRVLMGGRPLASAQVHAGSVDWTADAPLPDTGIARQAGSRDQSLTSDRDGIIRVVVDRGGMWNVRGLQILPARKGSGADWDVHWATIVFQAGSPVSEGIRVGGRDDSTAVADAVQRYGAALVAGDSVTALSLLAPDAVILESGGVESREQYRNHHLPGDIAFARAVRTADSPIRVVVSGDVAWASSTSVAQGEYRGRAINTAGAELMVLTRGADSRWRIRAIHWSSRARAQP